MPSHPDRVRRHYTETPAPVFKRCPKCGDVMYLVRNHSLNSTPATFFVCLVCDTKYADAEA